MEFLKNVSIYRQNILDCFDKNGYKGEVIGVYNPDSSCIFEFVKNYQQLGFAFLIYSSNEIIINKDLAIKVETNFRRFYKQVDMFMINSLSDYHLLIEDLAGMQEKIFIFEDE